MRLYILQGGKTIDFIHEIVFGITDFSITAHFTEHQGTLRTITVSPSLQCLVQYVTYEVMASAYDISCPDPECEKQGVMHMSEIENLVGKELADKHKMFRLNTGKKELISPLHLGLEMFCK